MFGRSAMHVSCALNVAPRRRGGAVCAQYAGNSGAPIARRNQGLDEAPVRLDFCGALVILAVDRVEALAAKQRPWRSPVDLDVVDGVRDDLRRPRETPRRAAQEIQLDGAKQHAADA